MTGSQILHFSAISHLSTSEHEVTLKCLLSPAKAKAKFFTVKARSEYLHLHRVPSPTKALEAGLNRFKV